ncbi:MAG: TonB-dependent receptor [Bacteroidia bacterium]
MAYAQSGDKVELTGTVVDAEGSPIMYASAALFNSSDSSMAGGAATDGQGLFLIEARPGSYYLRVSFVSYQTEIISDILIESSAKDLGRITLRQSSVVLKAAEITEERSQMELKLDKRVFNVGTDLSNQGSNAVEILENVPSVSTDIDGNVSLRGSQNVRILIDGKPSGLASVDALRQLQGNMIESIEVITNPSARYEAEGEVGIINIILKKEKRNGFNGSFEAFTGWPHNHGIGGNLNYRRKWVNVFSNYSLNYRSAPGQGSSIQQFMLPDTSFSYERLREHTRSERSNNLQLGTDFFLNEHNTLTLSGLYSYGTGTNRSQVIYRDFNQEGGLVQTVTREDEELETENEIEVSLGYRKTFKKKDQLFTADFKWISDDDTELSDIVETTDLGGPPLNQRSSNEEDEQNWLFQTDYIHPFSEDGKLEMGARSTMRRILNDYTVEQQEASGDWLILPQFDDEFTYEENIFAGYLMAGNKIKDFSYQAGIRAEYSDITTELVETQISNPRNYLDWFPSLHFSYEMKKENTLQLSYSRRLSRPHFRNLLPFFSFSDPRNFRSGNPDLDPEYTHSIELGHLKYFKNGSILSTIYYRHRTGVIERIQLPDTTGFVTMFPVNLSTQNAYGLEFNGNYDIRKWWKITANFNFYRAITEGSYQGELLGSDTYTWSARGSSKIKIKQRVDLQTTFFYRAPRITTQGRRKSLYMVDAGASTEVLKGKGTLTLSCRDLLNSRKWRSITETADYYAESEFQWRARQVLLSFSYRINQNKKNAPRQEGDGGEGEGF